MQTPQKLIVPEKVAIYRAGKIVYNGPGGHQLAPRELFKQASRGILTPAKREHSKSYCYVLETLVKGETPKSLATKTVQWWPPEWEVVLDKFNQAVNEGKSKKDAAIFANRSLPKDRQRNDKSQVFPTEISKMSVAMRKYDKPTTASPFIAAPLPPAEPEAQQEPPQDAQQPQHFEAPRVDMTESMGNAMAGLGPALSVVLTELLKTMGQAVGREIGKHVEAAVETIGNKMQASMAETMYQMRMGILAGRQPPAFPQTVQAGSPVPEKKSEPVKTAGNGFTGRKRVLVIGLLPSQEQMIANENTHLDFKFMSREAPGDRIKHVALNCDATYVMLNFVSHSVTDALRKANGGPGYGGVKGMMDALTLRLRDDFPRQGVARDTPRNKAEAAHAETQH